MEEGIAIGEVKPSEDLDIGLGLDSLRPSSVMVREWKGGESVREEESMRVEMPPVEDE